MQKQFLPQRRSPRLQGYDYAQAGAYFVTICTAGRVSWFGNIVNDVMNLSEVGQLTQFHWDDLPNHFAHVDLDAFVVMPNHVHGVIVLTDQLLADGMDAVPTPAANYVGTRSIASAKKRPQPLGVVVGTYKAAITRSMNRTIQDHPDKLWQPRYHERIIRNERELNQIRQYVYTNPSRWKKDTFFE